MFQQGQSLSGKHVRNLSHTSSISLQLRAARRRWPTETLKKWHRAVELNERPESRAQAKKILADILHPEIEFHPPTYWKKRVGIRITQFILRNVGEVFQDFKYTRCFVDSNGTNAVLEFSAIVPGIKAGEKDRRVQGVDILEMEGPSGRITDFKVMVRPPKAALLLKRHMNARVAKVIKLMAQRNKN